MPPRHDKFALIAEDWEPQRKEEENQWLENLRRQIEEEEDIPNYVYRHHIQEDPH